MTVWCWLFMYICRSASITRNPLGKTSTTRPERLVVSVALEDVCAWPFKVRVEFGEKRFCRLLLVPRLPIKALIPELAEKVRADFTAPSSAAVVDSTT